MMLKWLKAAFALKWFFIILKVIKLRGAYTDQLRGQVAQLVKGRSCNLQIAGLSLTTDGAVFLLRVFSMSLSLWVWLSAVKK